MNNKSTKAKWEEDFDKEFSKWGFLANGIDGWKKTNFKPKEYVKNFIKEVIAQTEQELKGIILDNFMVDFTTWFKEGTDNIEDFIIKEISKLKK